MKPELKNLLLARFACTNITPTSSCFHVGYPHVERLQIHTEKTLRSLMGSARDLFQILPDPPNVNRNPLDDGTVVKFLLEFATRNYE